MTATEDAIDALTQSTTSLLEDVAADIAAAVVVSENASQVPLVSIANSVLATQTSFLVYINESSS
jgi:dihydroneopterin aldolase